jgi:hypothetical protein
VFPPAASSSCSRSKSLDNRFYRCRRLNHVLSEGYMLFRISEKRNPLPPPPRPLFTLDVEEHFSDTFVYLYQTTKRPDTEGTNHDVECSVSRVTSFNTLYTELAPHHKGQDCTGSYTMYSLDVCMQTKPTTQ